MKKLTANYHTHTYRCGHAKGKDREYVENAIRAGLKVLGFSDHSPMVFRTDYYSGFRMKLEDTPGYFESLLRLREEYKNDIEIKIGVETEYYPDLFPGYLNYMSQFPLDYMILGQHFVWYEEGGGESSFHKTTDENRLSEYYKCLLEAVDTGKFLYVAHPEVLNFVGDREAYERLSRDFIKEIVKRDIPLEINRLGLREHRHYPNPDFWDICGQEGVKAVIGLDAHSPDVFLDEEGVRLCLDFAEKHGVKVLNAE